MKKQHNPSPPLHPPKPGLNPDLWPVWEEAFAAGLAEGLAKEWLDSGFPRRRDVSRLGFFRGIAVAALATHYIIAVKQMRSFPGDSALLEWVTDMVEQYCSKDLPQEIMGQVETQLRSTV